MDCRPRNHLDVASKLYPNAWKQADDFRNMRGKDLPDWPAWCFLPMAGWYSIVSATHHLNRLTPELIGDVGRLSALGAWRVTQGVYRFDPDIYCSLMTTSIGGNIPCDVLYRLPEWSVYIETPGADFAGDKQYGFWAHLEHDANDGRHELRLLLDMEKALLPLPLHIGHWSVEEALDRMINQASIEGFRSEYETDQISNAMVPHIAPMLSLVLYLCSVNADYGDAVPPRKPKPAKTKTGPRLFPPAEPRTWDVGVRIGAAIRSASPQEEIQGGTHARPRPHIRRAHWHTFRVGAERAQTRIKWLPPIPINVDDADELPSVIWPVKKH